MNVAEKVIQKFGGQSTLAGFIGKRQSTVQYWAKSGTIPTKWQSKLLTLAAEKGISLSPRDFIEKEFRAVEVIQQSKKLPQAKYSGFLKMPDNLEIPCYVLDDGRRIISRTGATNALTETSSSDLESYLKATALQEYLNPDIYSQIVEFEIGVPKTTMGIEAETFLDICKAYVKARDEGKIKLTARQLDIAKKASRFLMACAKVGLIALIDEATGFQYDREQDALQFKLRVYLEDEMRPWEKTFPDELWKEFGRLTNWNGSVLQRPKYWGKLVMELIYDYLDKDVSDWLRDNAPKPRGNLSYHRWLTSQYGLKKLIEHIWMIIGMAKTCFTMAELREKVAMQFGRQLVQLNMFLPPPSQINSGKEVAKNQLEKP